MLILKTKIAYICNKEHLTKSKFDKRTYDCMDVPMKAFPKGFMYGHLRHIV
jgi:hypothetical protein